MYNTYVKQKKSTTDSLEVCEREFFGGYHSRYNTLEISTLFLGCHKDVSRVNAITTLSCHGTESVQLRDVLPRNLSQKLSNSIGVNALIAQYRNTICVDTKHENTHTIYVCRFTRDENSHVTWYSEENTMRKFFLLNPALYTQRKWWKMACYEITSMTTMSSPVLFASFIDRVQSSALSRIALHQLNFGKSIYTLYR